MGAAVASPSPARAPPERRRETDNGGGAAPEQELAPEPLPEVGLPRYLTPGGTAGSDSEAAGDGGIGPDAMDDPTRSAETMRTAGALHTAAGPVDESVESEATSATGEPMTRSIDEAGELAGRAGRAAGVETEIETEPEEAPVGPATPDPATARDGGGDDGAGGDEGASAEGGGSDGGGGAGGGAEGGGGEGGGASAGAERASGGGGGAGGPTADAGGGDGGDLDSLDALSTGDLALIDTELAEHQRWGAAAERVGAAGSSTRADFVVQQAGAGALGGFGHALGTGFVVGAGTRLAEVGVGRLVARLAGPALARSFPLPAIGAVIGGVMSAYDLATRDWSRTGETIGRFGEGASVYEQLANSIAAVSEIIGIATAVLNVIAGVIGAISIAMWVITVLTVGVATPLAATLSTIAGAIGLGTMVLDGINAMVLQRLVTMFRALHTFTSNSDPLDVEAQGGRIGEAAGASAGFIGGMAGGLAGAGVAGAGARRLGLSHEPPPHLPDHETPPAASGDGPTITADPPPAVEGAPAVDAPAAPSVDAPSTPAVDGPVVPGVDAPTASPDTGPILPPADPSVPIPDIPKAPGVPDIGPLPDYGPELPGHPEAPALPVDPAVPVDPLGPTERPVDPLGPTERPVDPLGPTERPVDPLGPTERPVDPLGPTERPVDPLGPTERPVEPAIPEGRRIADDQRAGPERRAPTPEEIRSAEIEQARLEEIGEKRRMAEGGGLVDPEFQNLPEEPGRARRRGDPRAPDQSVVPERVKADLRARARAAAGLELQQALNGGEHNARTMAALEYLSDAQLDHVRLTGELPPGVEFHHMLSVADFPEFAHLAESGVPLPEDLHTEMGHGGDTTAPLETATFRDPDAPDRPGFHEDPQARKYNRPNSADVADGRSSTGDVTRDLITERQARIRELESRARMERDPARAEALRRRADGVRGEINEINRLLDAERAANAPPTPDAAPTASPDTPAASSSETSPATSPDAAPGRSPDAATSSEPAPRRAGEGETRGTEPLSDAEFETYAAMAERMGMPRDQIQRGSRNTAYLPGSLDTLLIGPDIHPLPEGERPTGLANPANAALEPRAVLGHEIIGHREAELMGQARDEPWHEELQASARAGLHTPDLTPAQRWLLIEDAAARRRFQEGDGEIYINTERPGDTSGGTSRGEPRPDSAFRPQDRLPSVIVNLDAPGPAASSSGSPPVLTGVASTPAGAMPRIPPVPRGPSGARAPATAAPGTWSRVVPYIPGSGIVRGVGDVYSQWFGAGRMTAPAGVRYDAAARARIARGGSIGSAVGSVLGGGPVGSAVGGFVGRRVGEGVARRAEDFSAGRARGNEPVVEHVSPAYPPPPGSPQAVTDLQNRLIDLLDARARAEALERSTGADAAHHEANAAPLDEFQQRTEATISATQAHEAAVANREAANQQRQAEEGNVGTTLGGFADRAAGLAMITEPLRAFTSFTYLAHALPDSPDVLKGAKRGILKMNSDGQQFLEALDGAGGAVQEQQAAQPARQAEADANGARIAAVSSGATASQAQLSQSSSEGQALASRNESRAQESRGIEQRAGAARAQAGGEAEETRGEIQTLSAQWQAWANAHRQARETAVAQTRERMIAAGYRPREGA